MKQALISIEETVYKFDGTPLGSRVAQVADTAFEVASPLVWVECADDVNADEFFYDVDTASIIAIPVPPPPPVIKNETTEEPVVI